MLDLIKMSKEERIEKEYYISFNEYVENCGYKYVYGAMSIKWKKYKNYFEKKGLFYDDYCNEILCGIIKDWNKIDYTRGSAKTYIGMKINTYHLHLIKYYDAEKRDINEDSLLYLNKETETNNETNEATLSDVIRSCDDIQIEQDENDLIDNIIKLLKSENQKISFRLYLKGYNYTEIEQILKQKGLNRTYTSIRSDVSKAKKFLTTRYNAMSLLERL